MPDTLVANITESTQEIIETTQLMLPEFAPCLELVTRINIPKGRSEAELPAVNTFPTVQTPAEGEEVGITYQYDLTSVTISPVERSILVRVTKRAERFSQDNLIANISEVLSQAQGRDIDQDILAQFQNFGSGNDLGSNTADLPLATLRTAMRLMRSITPANGGPAPAPFSAVFSPVACEDLMADIGVQGVVGSTTPWIPAGISQEQIQRFGLVSAGAQLMLLGAMVYMDSNIDNDSFGAASGGNAGALFSKKALYLAMSQEWDLETFTESEWLGPILRVYADFDTGVSPYDLRGSFILTDGI